MLRLVSARVGMVYVGSERSSASFFWTQLAVPDPRPTAPLFSPTLQSRRPLASDHSLFDAGEAAPNRDTTVLERRSVRDGPTKEALEPPDFAKLSGEQFFGVLERGRDSLSVSSVVIVVPRCIALTNQV